MTLWQCDSLMWHRDTLTVWQCHCDISVTQVTGSPDTETLWHYHSGTVTLCHCDTLDSVSWWHCVTVTLWQCITVTLWHSDTLTLWHYDIVSWCRSGKAIHVTACCPHSEWGQHAVPTQRTPQFDGHWDLVHIVTYVFDFQKSSNSQERQKNCD